MCFADLQGADKVVEEITYSLLKLRMYGAGILLGHEE